MAALEVAPVSFSVTVYPGSARTRTLLPSASVLLWMTPWPGCPFSIRSLSAWVTLIAPREYGKTQVLPLSATTWK